MKKLLMQFSDNVLSRSQMKAVKGGEEYGGDGVGCWCVYELTANSNYGRCSTKAAPAGTTNQDCNGICLTGMDPIYCLNTAELRASQTCPFGA